jgi:MtN3 and saliva related transmembrane protein
MEFIDIVGIVAGLCTSAALFPQIIKTVKTKKTADVSIGMFIILCVGNSLWVYYGADKEEVAIISTNILSLVLNITMLALKMKYKD